MSLWLVAAALATGCLDGADRLDAAVDGAPPDAADAGIAADAADAGIDGAVDAETSPDAAIDPCAAPPDLIDGAGLVERPLCAATPDAVAIRAPAGAIVTAAIEPTVAATVAVRRVGGTAPLEVDRVEVAADARVELSWVAPAEPVTLSATADAAGGWRVGVTVEARPSAAPTEVRGRIGAWSRPVDAVGLGAPVAASTAGARVDLVDAAGRLIAADRVDADGDFALVGSLPPDAAAVVRLVAQLDGGGSTVRVGPDALLPWAEPVAEVVGGGAIDVALDPEGATTAALHVARVAAAGLDRIAPLLPVVEAPPPVVYRWRPGFSAGCGSCFRPGPAPLIDLGGRISDPDEWDDAVVLHELGHHLAAVYSRDDSPGGPHGGDRTAPAIAWSEGLATFHAGWQLGAAVQYDYKVTGVASTDLERADDPLAFGVDGDALAGDVSERLVSAVLWDLYDDGPADDDDAALGDATFAPVFGALAAPSTDRGAAGVDLVDYLDALWCPAPPLGAGEVLDARAFPYDAPPCRAKGDGALRLERDGDAVVLMARVDGWLVLRDAAVSRRRVRAGERVRWRPVGEGSHVGAELWHGADRAVVSLRWRGVDPPPAPIRRRAGAWERAR